MVYKRRHFGKITGHHSRPQFHLSLLGALVLLGTWRHLVANVGTSKGWGRQWQTTPKNVPRMQRAKALLVTWLGPGSCQKPVQGLNINNNNRFHICLLFGHLPLCLLCLSHYRVSQISWCAPCNIQDRKNFNISMHFPFPYIRQGTRNH
jgi:hypothetical protein